MTPRLEGLRRRLAELGLDAILISASSNRRYLSGFTGSAGYLLISADQALLATDFRYTEQARRQAAGFAVTRITGSIADWFPDLLAKLGVSSIGIESEDLSLSIYRLLARSARRLPRSARPRLRPTNGVVESLRMVKDEQELSLMQQAAALADGAAERVRALVQPGATEKQVAWELEKFLREEGSEMPPFDIIVAAGPNSALPHAQPSDHIIGQGEPVVVDLGARVCGYCSDITRTICLGDPDDTFTRVYGVVREAQRTALGRLRVGMTGNEVHQLAMNVIEHAGYADAFGHGLGHGVGLDVHEPPRLGPGSTDVLKEGMVFTIEPGIYIEGWGGVRMEDMVLLRESAPRALTHASRLETQEDG